MEYSFELYYLVLNSIKRFLTIKISSCRICQAWKMGRCSKISVSKWVIWACKCEIRIVIAKKQALSLINVGYK